MLGLLWIPDWFWHPLAGKGYQFWSGIGSDLGEYTIALALIGGLVRSYRQHVCHVETCHRLAWHPDPGHGHPVCKRHHPHTGRCVQTDDGSSRLEE